MSMVDKRALKTVLFGSAVLFGGCQFIPGAGAPQKSYVPQYATVGDMIRGRKKLNFQRPAPAPVPFAFQRWIETEPGYRLYPGDQLDIVVGSAPELSRTLTIAPDGRVNMPMSRPVMAAGRTLPQLREVLMRELSTQLRDPTVAVTPRAFVPQQVFVGGEVAQPGTYTLPGPIGAVETVFMAGGLRPTAQAKEVAVLRRAPNGGMMMRVVNLRAGLANIREYNDTLQLRRGDIVFVPRNTLGEVGVFAQNLRNALPVDFNLSYQFGQDFGSGTTVISP